MSSLQPSRSDLASLFVTSAFLGTFSAGLAAHITMLTDPDTTRESEALQQRGARQAFALADILCAASGLCSYADVKDEESLHKMLQSIRGTFSVIRDCNEADSELVWKTVNHIYALAEDDARQTFEEVSAGFPVSAGSFPVWREELWRRAEDVGALFVLPEFPYV